MAGFELADGEAKIQLMLLVLSGMNHWRSACPRQQCPTVQQPFAHPPPGNSAV